jgi:hypothetical protein
VVRVLPGSDLYGKVSPGDRLISEDGLDPLECWLSGQNFGPVGSVVQVTFVGQNGLQTIACHRKPVSELFGAWVKELNWSALGR